MERCSCIIHTACAYDSTVYIQKEESSFRVWYGIPRLRSILSFQNAVQDPSDLKHCIGLHPVSRGRRRSPENRLSPLSRPRLRQAQTMVQLVKSSSLLISTRLCNANCDGSQTPSVTSTYPNMLVLPSPCGDRSLPRQRRSFHYRSYCMLPLIGGQYSPIPRRLSPLPDSYCILRGYDLRSPFSLNSMKQYTRTR